MDWQDYHLHEFTVTGRAYGVPDPDFDADREVADDRVVRLRDLNLSVGDRIQYAYDFGDDWQHGLELEDVGQSDAANTGPVCLDGERSAPPEDVGGPPGYEEFLQALSDPDHEEHEHMKSWVGRPFDPKYFSVEEANQRLRKRFRHRKSAQKA